MELLHQLIDLFLNLDQHLNHWAALMGPWLYLLVFAIVFCETGLVVTPFLPGDSLLFALGALAAVEGSPINVYVLVGLLIVAAILGDNLNFFLGGRFGTYMIRTYPKLIRKEHIARTEQFFEKHGGKSIVFARFAPILRTFAPFVAGLARMDSRRFLFFNVFGAIVWVTSFTFGGYLFGNLPIVKKQFHWAILAIVVISLLPVAIEFVRAWWNRPGHLTPKANDT